MIHEFIGPVIGAVFAAGGAWAGVSVKLQWLTSRVVILEKKISSLDKKIDSVQSVIDRRGLTS